MSQGMDNDIEGRVRGRTAELQRAVAARFKLIAAAAIVGGFALSLAITLSDSVGKHFEYALLGEAYVAFLFLGGLLALFTWWRYQAAVRRLPGMLARSTGQPEVSTTDLQHWYSKGSLGTSTSWEKPSVVGEEDQDPNQPAR
jgi:hypothetical protein